MEAAGAWTRAAEESCMRRRCAEPEPEPEPERLLLRLGSLSDLGVFSWAGAGKLWRRADQPRLFFLYLERPLLDT
jgi:hypothetical protein